VRKIIFVSKYFKPFYLTLALLLFFTATGCDAITSDDDTSFQVKFENSQYSEYSITSIQVQEMGHVENSQPSGTWSGNILPSGTSIAPGEYVFFELNIPNGHYDVYRIGVNDGTGNQLMLHEQTGAGNWSNPTITHWGADNRTCSATLKLNPSSGLIYISGWSDNAGIE